MQGDGSRPRRSFNVSLGQSCKADDHVGCFLFAKGRGVAFAFHSLGAGCKKASRSTAISEERHGKNLVMDMRGGVHFCKPCRKRRRTALPALMTQELSFPHRTFNIWQQKHRKVLKNPIGLSTSLNILSILYIYIKLSTKPVWLCFYRISNIPTSSN